MTISNISGISSTLSSNLIAIGSITPSDGVFIVGDGSTFIGESGNTARSSLGLGTGDTVTFTNLTITNQLTVQTLISSEDLEVTDQTITLNNGGTTASTTGSGILIEGDSGSTVGYFRVNGSDNSLLEFKSPGNAAVLTIDIDATETLTIGGSLNVEADSNINQDVTTDGAPTFGAVTVDNINIDANTISSTDTNGNINLDPNGSGRVVVSGATGYLDVLNDSWTSGATSIINIGTIVGDARQIKASFNNGIDFRSNGDALRLDTSSNVIVFNNLTVNGTFDLATNQSFTINGTSIISDSSGTATLSNIDALDATTEATIEAAMDTLSNVTSLGTLSSLQVDNINIDSSTISSTDTDGSINISPDGAGRVIVKGATGYLDVKNNTWTSGASSFINIGVSNSSREIEASFANGLLFRCNGLALTLDTSSNVVVENALTVKSTTSLQDDLTIYDAANDDNPQVRIGSSDTEEVHIQAVYDSGAQTLDYVLFQTDVASATANKGLYRFNVDGSDILDIDDGGIDLDSGKAISIAGTQVVASRQTGWGAPTGTATRTTFATSTVTTEQLAERVHALIDDLTTHGLIGS